MDNTERLNTNTMRPQDRTKLRLFCGTPIWKSAWQNPALIILVGLIAQRILVYGEPIDRTINMNPAEVLNYYGYPAETHRIVTEDEYILSVHRIPQATKRPPVLIMHGILDSSFTWLLSGPETALGFQLYKNGYDVWLGNFRGNVYSRAHKSLSTKRSEYWDFSWDDMGRKDLPAVVDYMINITGHPQIFHIGHSMGTTTFFVLTSSMPEYNNKFVAHFAFSPVGYWANSASFFWKILAPVETALMEFSLKSNHGGFLIDNDADALREFCRLNPNSVRLCKLFLHFSFGYSNVFRNQSIYEVFTNHVPAGTSVKAFNHYSQLLKSGKFREYDYYDSRQNMQRYSVPQPRDYNVSNILVPISFHYAANDVVSAPKDVLRLYRQIRNPIGLHLIQDRLFNHVDFTIDPSAYRLLYKKVIKMMNSL